MKTSLPASLLLLSATVLTLAGCLGRQRQAEEAIAAFKTVSSRKRRACGTIKILKKEHDNDLQRTRGRRCDRA